MTAAYDPSKAVEKGKSGEKAAGGKLGKEASDQVNKIRVTLTGRNHIHLERVTAALIARAKGHKNHPKIKGPVRMPTKVLRITTRKTQCGEGSKTWDRFEMRIHKRVIELRTTVDAVKDIVNVDIDPGVEVDVSLLKFEKKPSKAPKKKADEAVKQPEAVKTEPVKEAAK